jgi:hypothetical protein
MSKGEPLFARVPPRAAADRSLQLSALRVLIAICSHANNGVAFPGLPAISTKTGIDCRNLPGAIAALERAGYLRRDGWHRSHKGRSRTRKYQVLYDSPNSSHDMTTAEAANSSHGMTSTERASSSHDMTSCPGMTSCGGMQNIMPGHELEAAQLMPGHDQTDQEEGTDQGTDQKSMPIADNIELEFVEFWALVPKKIDRAESQKLFRHARTKKRVPFDALLTGMRRHAELFAPHTSDDPKFSTGPAKWLRGEKWNDEVVRPAGPQFASASAGGLLGAVERSVAAGEFDV